MKIIIKIFIKIFGGACFLFLRRNRHYLRWGNNCGDCFIALLTNLNRELAYSARVTSLTFTVFLLGVFRGYPFYNFSLRILPNASSIEFVTIWSLMEPNMHLIFAYCRINHQYTSNFSSFCGAHKTKFILYSNCSLVVILFFIIKAGGHQEALPTFWIAKAFRIY